MTQTGRFRGFTTFDLKCIAVCSMLLDHIGAALFPTVLWLRLVGRLAFPIYCFLLVEGFMHTHNVKKYMSRLFLFALISELPFDLAFYHTPVYVQHQNVFFTLLLGLICVWALHTWQNRLYAALFLVLIGLLTHFVIKPDYGIVGILIILCFYVLRGHLFLQWFTIIVLCYYTYGLVECFCLPAAFLTGCYNGTRGPSAKYFFYAFYPVHILCLYLIWRYIGNVNF